MPKKKKKDSKKKRSSSGTDDSENDDVETKRKELLQTAKKLKTEIENETKKKEEFDEKLKQVQFYWNLEKEEQLKKKVELESRERKEEELVEKHESQIEDMKEKIKELLYQQQNDLIRAKNERRLELYKTHGKHSMDQNKNDATSIECQHHLRNMQVSHNNFMNRLQHDYESQIRRLQDEFKVKFREITIDSDRKIKIIGEEVDESLKKDLASLEAKKEAKVKEVLSQHDQELTELRNRYNMRIHDQLDQVKVLKGQLQVRKLQLRQTEKKMNETRMKNKNIVEPLAQAQEEVDNLQVKCEEFRKQKRVYNKRKGELKLSEEKLKDVQWRHEVLFQQYELLVNKNKSLKEDVKRAKMRERQRRNLDLVIQQKGRKELITFLNHYHDLIIQQEEEKKKKGEGSSLSIENNVKEEYCNGAEEVQTIKGGVLQKIEQALQSLVVIEKDEII